MVIAILAHGMGNQLFQYAFARKLAALYNDRLYIDIEDFTNNPYHKQPEKKRERQYALECFSLPVEIVSFAQVEHEALRFYNRLWLNRGRSVVQIKEKEFTYQPSSLQLDIHGPQHIYVTKGFWQSEKYFSDIRNLLLRDFRFKFPATGENDRLLREISQCHSVAVHIRRGDFAGSEHKRHGTLEAAYYQYAVAKIQEHFPQARFYIFSDEPEWVQANFHFFPEESTIISHNKDVSVHFEDLRLMMECKHQIIANSTFSWWGAWLNTNPEKMVIAPKQWFNQATENPKDLIPDSWIRL